MAIVSPRATCLTEITSAFLASSLAESVGKGDFLLGWWRVKWGWVLQIWHFFYRFSHHFLSPSLSNHLLVLRLSNSQPPPKNGIPELGSA